MFSMIDADKTNIRTTFFKTFHHLFALRERH